MKKLLIVVGMVLAATARAEVSVDLSNASGTMGDKRMHEVDRSHDGAGQYREPYGAQLDGLYLHPAKTGLCNMALVSASDLRQAIEEVHLLLGIPENRSRRVQEGQHPWLFVFLGVREGRAAGINSGDAMDSPISHFFIHHLPKGVYVFEYGVRVQLKGRYQTGIASVQCMSAPEFNSDSERFTIEVE